MRHALGLSLWGRLRLKLTPRGRANGTFCRMIGDAIERVSNARQFKCKLVDPAGPLQYDNSFSAEVNSDPEHQPTHKGYRRHKHVMAGDRDTSARNGNHEVREQSFLPAGVLDWNAAYETSLEPSIALLSGFIERAQQISVEVETSS
jgi:hypothetical protein